MYRFVSLLLTLSLIAAFAAQSGAGLRDDAQTSDEAVHLAAGLSYLETGDYRMNPEHPPLAKLWAALPLYLSDVRLPLDHPAWRQGREWTFGAAFLYRNERSVDQLLALGRVPILFLGILTLLLVRSWAVGLYGPAAGLVAMAFAAFDPGLIAHSHYVTSDVALALAFSSSLYTLWRYRATGRRRWLFATALLTGMTVGTKYSGMLLLPIIGIGLWPEAGSSRDRRARLLTWAGRLSAVLTGCYLVLAVAYQGEPLEPYLRGYRGMQAGWNSFLLGEVSKTGFYHYFLAVLALKTPPATLLAVVIALASMRRLAPRPGEWLLLSAAAFFFLVSSVLRINIGMRHILPVDALLLLLTGRLLLVALPGAGRLLALVLPLATATEVAWNHPYHLSYFSSLAGGAWEGHRYLSDSNLDWGQDLKRLAAWTEREQVDGLLFGVFTGADPATYGLRYQALPGFGAIGAQEKPLEPFPQRIVVAISAMNLQGVYFAQSGMYPTVRPIDPTLYRFLLERPPLLRLTPSIWLWDVTDDPDLLQRIALIYINFRWFRSAIPLLGRYVVLRPEDLRVRAALEGLRRDLDPQAP